MRLRGSALDLMISVELPPRTTIMSKSSRRSWASLKEIWEPMMTPASDRTLGSLAAMVMSKALASMGEVTRQQAAGAVNRAWKMELGWQLELGKVHTRLVDVVEGLG